MKKYLKLVFALTAVAAVLSGQVAHSIFVDSADHASTATTSQQTLSSVAIGPGGSFTSPFYGQVGNWTKITLRGEQASNGNVLSVTLGTTALTIFEGQTLGTGTRFTIECDVFITGTNAEKITCTSGLGQNQAGPYVDDDVATESTTSAVTIAVKASTNGSTGDITLKSFTVVAMNY